MERNEALSLLEEHVQNKKIQKHCLAVAAIMEKLAEKLGEDREVWWLTGILHDLDYEETMNDMERHGLETAEMLEGKVEEKILHAIKAHNGVNTGVAPRENMDIALLCSDALSGLMISTALIMPSKKVSEVTVEGLQKKFKKKDFARAVSREKMMTCRRLNLTQEDFFAIGIEALAGISGELGL
ncbi:MAG: HDIG domain-containing metalloprotein [Candidatus Aenigmatarchaeota archaeon]